MSPKTRSNLRQAVLGLTIILAAGMTILLPWAFCGGAILLLSAHLYLS